VRAEDPQGTSYNLTIEHIGEPAALTGTKQVVVKLPELSTHTDLFVTVTLRGLTSNRGLLKTKP
jgi:hypothetical protein